jgi:hypothetical protein
MLVQEHGAGEVHYGPRVGALEATAGGVRVVTQPQRQVRPVVVNPEGALRINQATDYEGVDVLPMGLEHLLPAALADHESAVSQ